ncbi:GNAT family N-acetyltransferase [uncultured Microbulbifer sp.]|uniref:GNAT family N-acetyltransferase n=1 Tax=uncultured Microbulbifer sp. TaxID=348147 RepID=UPI00262252CE|nr:GNAT family N-acetyltransferase [uncultured Microbulbifer sp.]
MNIRMASKHDVSAIADIHSTSWQENYSNVLSTTYLEKEAPADRLALWNTRFEKPQSNQQVLVAEVDGNTAGFVCLFADKHPEWGSHLDNLHVRKAYRSLGIGHTLFIEAARWAYQQAPSKGMCLLVNQDNTKAQAFYQRLGGRKAQESIWNAADGSKVATYWYVWEHLRELTN